MFHIFNFAWESGIFFFFSLNRWVLRCSSVLVNFWGYPPRVAAGVTGDAHSFAGWIPECFLESIFL